MLTKTVELLIIFDRLQLSHKYLLSFCQTIIYSRGPLTQAVLFSHSLLVCFLPEVGLFNQTVKIMINGWSESVCLVSGCLWPATILEEKNCSPHLSSFYMIYSTFLVLFFFLVIFIISFCLFTSLGAPPRLRHVPCNHWQPASKYSAVHTLFTLLHHQENSTLHPSVLGRGLNQAYLMWRSLCFWTAGMMMTTRRMKGCFRVKLAPTPSHL